MKSRLSALLFALAGGLVLPWELPATPIAPGPPLERVLQEGICDPLELPTTGGRWLFRADQMGVDLALTPIVDGERGVKVDRPSARRGTETVYLELKKGQKATLEVCGGPPGAYRAALVDLADAAAEERRAWADDTLAARANQAGDRQRAAELWSAAAESWRRLERPRERADALTWAGFALRGADPGAAQKHFEAAEASWRELGEPYDQARVLNELGFLHGSAGRGELAIDHYRRALLLWRQVGDRGGEARTLNNLGLALHHQGKPAAAREPYGQALAIFRELGDRSREATALSNLAAVATELGEARPARLFHQDALAIFRQLANPREEARVLSNLGQLELQLGRFQRALELARQALAVQRKVGSPAELASTLNNLGRVYLELGDGSSARRALEEALELDRSAGGASAGFLWHNLGRAALLEGGTVAALSSFERAQALHRTRGDRRAETESSLARADILLKQGRLDDTRAELASTGALAEAVGMPSLRLGVLARQSELALRRGDCVGAAAVAASGLELARQLQNASFEAEALLARARTGLACGDVALADADARAALALVEDLRAELVELELRATFLANRRRAFDTAIATTLARFDRSADPKVAAQAFGLTERGRSRLFLDLLERETPADVELALDPALARDLLDGETTLLAYWVGEMRSAIFAIDRQGLQVFPLAARAVLERQVREALGDWRVLDDRDDDTASLAALGQQLVPARLRQGGRRLALVLDGPLLSLPFAALPVGGGRVLIDDHDLVVLPSASALHAQRRNELQGHGIVAFADPVYDPRDPRLPSTAPSPFGASAWPRLPRSGEEAAALASWAAKAREPWQAFTGPQATVPALLALADRPRRILHLASHAEVDAREPARSALLLSFYDASGRPQPGRLELEALSRSGIQAELVVLSGCGTALGPELAGEGLIGLARAFQMAGAPRVLASLWSLDDRATAELMAAFYQAHLGEGLHPAAALRVAQRHLRSQREFRDPFYWAPFILVGDWR